VILEKSSNEIIKTKGNEAINFCGIENSGVSDTIQFWMQTFDVIPEEAID
jgi:hypothetical protein